MNSSSKKLLVAHEKERARERDGHSIEVPSKHPFYVHHSVQIENRMFGALETDVKSGSREFY